ncbi:MAG: putative porin [Acidobacteria bacterium]|nr:putative porin [Acidobacteriota bacterium]
MRRLIGVFALLATGMAVAEAAEDDLAAMRAHIAAQDRTIADLKTEVEEQRRLLERLLAVTAAPATGAGTVSAAAVPAAQALTPAKTEAAAAPKTAAEPDARTVAGFRFSGDYRHRFDVSLRSGNEFAGPLQNVRNRYRVRLNIDKDIDPRFRFHLQLATAPYHNVISNDQDWGGAGVKHPFSLAEAWMDYHPNNYVSIRSGRMEEIFADHMRFLWDDDIRFNGFHQTLRLPLGENKAGFKTIELRSAEYILTHPNIPVLPATSPYVNAGYRPGQRVRSAALFHPGIIARGDLHGPWSQQVFGGVEVYTNVNQLQLASTGAGATPVVGSAIGLGLSGPISGTGNATTTRGGAIYDAGDFHVVHLGYRLAHKGLSLGNRELPAFFDLQLSRNVGASRLRDAVMASASVGSVQKFGDVRFLYQFAIKDANSMISQFADDNLGTGSGVNIAVHAFRWDLGITRFFEWQNLFFFVNPRRGNSPAEHFFVPVPRGANTTFRYLAQFAFTF